MENGEASGSFTDSGVSTGQSYSLYIDGTDISVSDTVSFSGFNGVIAFHHDTFANGGDPYGDGSVTVAAAKGHVYSDTAASTTYGWGTLTTPSYDSSAGTTTYTWTPTSGFTGTQTLLVAGGGGGGSRYRSSGGGGAGGYVYYASQDHTGTKTIVIGDGGNGGEQTAGTNGKNTTFSGLTTAVGGGFGGCIYIHHRWFGWFGWWWRVSMGVQVVVMLLDRVSMDGLHRVRRDKLVVEAEEVVQLVMQRDGGQGKDYSSVFGTSYGDNGFFVSGGGAGGQGGGGYAYPGGGGRGVGMISVVSDANVDGQKHTGGGGGAWSNRPSGVTGGKGGSGIVLVKTTTGTLKNIPKVTGASFDSTNVTFTVQGASNITNIKYTINGGSEQTTPVGTLAVAHGLSTSASITVVAYAVDANGAQISTKKTVTGTIP